MLTHHVKLREVEMELRTTAVVLAAVLSGSAASPGADGPAALGQPGSAALFERLKGLAGRWKGQSSRRGEEESVVKVIAGGSVVDVASSGAHPGEEMRTVYHMDGDRLLLTHYCIAKNQPRLVATAYDPSAGAARFEFLDATNLPSRDKGHMDKVEIRFVDEDHVVERWTWYANGKESWMEEADARRQR
jgi:hypothetical protein